MEKHIKEVLKKYIDQEPIGDVYYEQKIRTYIKEELNKSISERISSVSFRKGELTLSIPSSSLRHDLFMNKEKLITKFNDHIGDGTIRIIQFR